MDQVIDLCDAAAKRYPVKALCDEIGKAESTLRNELTEQPGYKLGLRTFILILKKTKDLRALDRVEQIMGRVAFPLPRASGPNLAPILRLVGEQAREFGEYMAALGSAIADGRISPGEAAECIREIDETMRAMLELKAHLAQYLSQECAE